MEITVMSDILGKNDEVAAELNTLLTRQGIFVVNLLGSPGCGKTSLVEQTVRLLRNEYKIAVIEGDLYTSKDADRIAAYGAPVIQINTRGGCHLDAGMVKKAVEQLDLSAVDILIVENVGNLVCPAEFAVGEHAKVVVLSVTEGEDKPLKYPLVFRQSEAIIINKIDLLPYTDFAIDCAVSDINGLNAAAALIKASCKTGEGLVLWTEWLKDRVRLVRRGDL
ncbi:MULTISPECIES: hydrogenase nickel incorporation protein HypB [Sporomusa]|uniref:Hydrogenase isoenzymes nickel incorporation protein HypB n=2 Tax=Sporomusa TaxID=2375 RepID=A0ABP2C5S1_9FIRM|nr:hydrogenase nickel incorporation protein HypB [Sporomusa sphaeroides]MCM0761410.1 hydrogenase nickel incorporation protein HypB [Sporomusa sphaeroides DSM 2875]OLS56581.1 hydrogenase isoenzymes nickel incorporation protein HypB [Sporomusa sphaeroides DSM 2875]CVK19051.1 Hydrogenase isoenzymes nickel incorporation protein HypB [Sporomusa sphaeroides DSM 2875]SCM82159.1 Hydrogenase nickel incorporation protein HypB [uncultured Sporomusa sp.]